VDAAVWISVVAASVTVVSLPFSVRAANSARLSVGEAHRQTELQERVHRDSAQPYVWADLQGDDAQGQLLRLIVTNEGPSIATAVHVTFEPPLQDRRRAGLGRQRRHLDPETGVPRDALVEGQGG
jgi:hypothetical protein